MKTPGIRTYLVISQALLLAVSLGAVGFIWSRTEYQVMTQELQNIVRERASLLSDIISHEIAEGDVMQLSEGETRQIGMEENLLAAYVDEGGALTELVPGSISSRDADRIISLSQEYEVTPDSFVTLVNAENGTHSIYASAPVFDDQNYVIGRVCLLMPINELDAYILRVRWMLVGALLVVTLAGVGISTLLTNYFSRQFSLAQKLASTVAEGNYHLRIQEAGPREFRDLSHYLNQMAENLEEQLKTRQTLLANVAHELARPLAGLRLGIESLRKGAMKDADLADDLLVSMEHTVRRFEALIDDLALAALPKTRPIDLFPAALAVEPFLQGVAARFWTIAESRGIRLEVRVDAGLPPVWADEKRLNQILGNLVDNAIKFTPRGKTVYLSANRADEANIQMLVQDGGQGISAEESDHLFEPFYQGESGRVLKQGMGLGLSIANQLAQVSGGNLTLQNHPAGGAVAILTLPAVNP